LKRKIDGSENGGQQEIQGSLDLTIKKKKKKTTADRQRKRLKYLIDE